MSAVPTDIFPRKANQYGKQSYSQGCLWLLPPPRVTEKTKIRGKAAVPRNARLLLSPGAFSRCGVFCKDMMAYKGAIIS